MGVKMKNKRFWLGLMFVLAVYGTLNLFIQIGGLL